MNVPLGLAHIDSGLDDDQIQSLVHQLRHEYTEDGGGPVAEHTQEAWDRFRSTTANRITAHPGLRPQRRAGLLRRITQADATSPADMAYAAQHIRDRAIRAARLMEDHLATEAARIGVPDHDVVATYEQGRRGAPTGRQARATDEDRRRWPGLPLDPRPRHGLAAVTARPDNPDGRRELIPAHESVRAEHTTVVAGVGYHPDSARVRPGCRSRRPSSPRSRVHPRRSADRISHRRPQRLSTKPARRVDLRVRLQVTEVQEMLLTLLGDVRRELVQGAGKAVLPQRRGDPGVLPVDVALDRSTSTKVCSTARVSGSSTAG
jgi:hypothetical protein